MSNITKKTELVEFNVTKLKEVAKGEQGQYIQLVDIEETKAKLKEIADKYKGLKITKENYKKEGAEAERMLRHSRYALQRIYKNNNAFINKVKAKEKETYEGLINLIEPTEKRIAEKIKKLKEEEAERKRAEAEAEAKRIKLIEDTLKETEFALEKAILKGKTDADLEDYDKFLDDFKSKFNDFAEFEFQAKRLHAIFTARRKELVEKIEAEKKAEQERKRAEAEAERLKKEAEELKKAKEEQKKKVLELRKKLLSKKGFNTDGDVFIKDDIKVDSDEVKDMDEVQWFEYLEELEKEEERILKAKEEAKKKEREKALKDWQDLLTIYEGLGGNVKKYKLKDGELPTEGQISELAKITRKLQAEKKALKVKGVKSEVEPIRAELETYIKGLKAKVKETKLKHDESRTILNNLFSKLDDVINEVFN